MEDLRAEIREAFAKEQAGGGPAVDLRRSVVSAVAARPDRHANLQWLAVAAVILITIAVVVGLMSSRLGRRASVPSHPQSTPTPVAQFTGDYGPPPAGVPLIYAYDPKHPTWLIGVDWTGKPRGTVKLGQPINPFYTLFQAPDGSAFLVEQGKIDPAQVFDTLGNPITQPSASYGFQMWSDDSTQLCTLDFRSGRWLIGVRTPGAAASVHPVAIDSSIVRSGTIAISFASCSPRNDEAILTYSYFQLPTEVWVVRISDGRILMHQSHAGGQLADIVASPDGKLIAENSAKSDGQIAPAAPSTIIRRVSDGSVVTTLDASVDVLAFSADDSRALVATSPWASGVPTQLALMDVPSGTVLWRSDGVQDLESFMVRPDGADFAVLMQATTDSSSHSPVDVVIVHGDGTVTRIPGQYIRP